MITVITGVITIIKHVITVITGLLLRIQYPPQGVYLGKASVPVITVIICFPTVFTTVFTVIAITRAALESLLSFDPPKRALAL